MTYNTENEVTKIAYNMAVDQPNGSSSAPKRHHLDRDGLPNPHLSSLESDFLYHIGYTREEVKQIFHDVKVSSYDATLQHNVSRTCINCPLF